MAVYMCPVAGLKELEGLFHAASEVMRGDTHGDVVTEPAGGLDNVRRFSCSGVKQRIIVEAVPAPMLNACATVVVAAAPKPNSLNTSPLRAACLINRSD